MDSVTVVLAAAVLALGIVLAVLLLRDRLRVHQPVDIGTRLDRHTEILQELRSKFELGDWGQNLIREELGRTGRALTALQLDLQARKKFDDENREVVKRLESVIAGSFSKGRAGENILGETFKLFPPEMLETEFRIGGRVVEFALKLSDGRVLAIDSKWPATPLLMALEEETDETRRAGIVSDIEKEVNKKVREVTGYIDPMRTVPWAVVALPDAVFSVCKRAFLDAYKLRVILISYSMALPYVLTFYSLHVQYARSIDVGNMQAHILDIERHLDEIEQVLENRIAKGSAMISNAYAEFAQGIGKIRGSLGYLKSIEGTADGAFLEEPSIGET
ncbi:MAG: DNA recombination protein RmuC [Candidatus Aquicultorales bacterium]